MKAIVLAAGQGKRLRSSIQKVLQPILGKTTLQYVIDAALGAGVADITVVVGMDNNAIKQSLAVQYPQLSYAVQERPLGTGHATLAGMGSIQADDDVLVLCGDMPLITSSFIAQFAEFFKSTKCVAAIAAVRRSDMGSFGRVYTCEGGMFEKIVEHQDMTSDMSPNQLANTGVCLFNGDALRRGLAKIGNNNSQNEYYLTDVPRILRDENLDVRVFEVSEPPSVFTGINAQSDLAEAVQHMQTRINTRHMDNGVRMVSPASTYIDDTVEIGQDTVLYPGTILEGHCKIANGVTVGANSSLKDAIVGDGVTILQSVVVGAVIAAGVKVGPFAYLRPDANIGVDAKIGSFVEIKNSTIGVGSKVPHLSYVGDATVGSDVNIGCGVVTANYNGREKNRTVIEDNAFVGCNVNLIAPVTIGAGAVVAAGSTVTKDVTSCALCIARAKQEELPGWASKEK